MSPARKRKARHARLQAAYQRLRQGKDWSGTGADQMIVFGRIRRGSLAYYGSKRA